MSGAQAQGLSRQRDRWWETRLPTRPRAVTDLRPLPTSEGLHILGGPLPQTLRGRDTGWLFGRLMPALDGTRTVDELGHVLPELATETLRDALHLLHMHGLLEDGDDGLEPSARETLCAEHGSQIAFFARALSITRNQPSGEAVQATLARSVVELVGDEATNSQLADLLRSLGVGEIRDTVGEGSDLQVVSLDASGALAHTRQALAKGSQTPMLFIEPERLRVGPLTHLGVNACPQCCALQWGTGEEGETEAPVPSLARLWRRAFLAHVAREVLGQLTFLYQPLALKSVLRWRPGAGAGESAFVVRLANCPVCGGDQPPRTVELASGHRESLALTYHHTTAVQPWMVWQPANFQTHLSPAVQTLTEHAFEEHNWAPRARLSKKAVEPASDETASSVASAVVPWLEDLQQILRYGAGGRCDPADDGGYQIRRFTASAGSLGSAEVHLWTPGVPGLAAGIYHYLLIDDSLERLTDGEARCETPQDTHATLLEGLGLASSERDTFAKAPIWLVVSSAYHRVHSKYGDRAYAYCLSDAGLLTHRLHRLAEAHGWRSRALWDFDDEGAAALVRRPRRLQPVAALLALQPPGDEEPNP